MQWFLLIMLCAGSFLLMRYLNNRAKSKLLDADLIVSRGNEFYKQAHIFTTRTNDFSAIAGAIDQNALYAQKISFEPNIGQEQIIFHNQISFGSFGARLRRLEPLNGIPRYKFQVEAWRDGQYGITRQDINGANVLLTAIERAFLSIDQNTCVERMELAYSTKPGLF